MKILDKERPFIITIIGDLNLLGAILSILSLFSVVTEKFRVENFINVLMFIILSMISYGFLKLKKLGYWLMIIFNLCLLVLDILSLQGGISANTKMSYTGIIWGSMNLIFAVPTRKYFY